MPRNSFYDGNAGDTIAIDNSAAAASASETAAAASEAAAAISETNAAASYDSFDDRYLGVKSSGPTLDNDGDALVDGALYFDTTTNTMMVYDLGGTTWNRTTPTTSDQTKINTVSGIAANVTTVAGISANVTTVAGISSDVTTVAGKATEIGRLGTADAVADMAILGTTDIVADMAILGTAAVVSDLNTLGTADVVSDLNTLGTADVVTDMNLLATSGNVTNMATLGASGVVSNISTVAGVAANVTTVAGISSDVTTVAGKDTEIGRLGTAAAVADMAILGTTDIVADMAILGTADVVQDLNTLGTADVVQDMNTLGTADVVLDMNTLGTADVVSDMNTLGTSANVTAMDTCASNITGINSFADRYRVSTTAPTTSLDEGDLYFNTTDNKMYRYNGTSWAEIVTYTGGTGVNISASNVISASSIALTTVQTAASQVLMLALTAQEGDVVVRTDEKKTYVKNSGSAGTMADFTLLETPTDAVTSVDGATGVVTLNHDTLTGFVANEHLDWTTDQGSNNVHADNYTDTVYTHPNHSGDVTSSGDGATTITNSAVTLAKMANIATDSFIGRDTAGAGVPEVLSAATTRTILNVADGAQVNRTLDASPTNGNTSNSVSSDGVFDALALKSDTSHTHSAYDAVGEAVAMAIALG